MNLGHISLGCDAEADASQLKVWGHREGRSVNSGPSPTRPTPSGFSIAAHNEREEVINKASDFGEYLDRISGGFLGVTRPDHLDNPTVGV
ncbi:hypothetical protein GQ44DRAFT_779678 [Phaeosphaeriaceae sp. PMI808]|nr:hypothetical protein GQ44DRAFT_779678 [Phaeosphaeriaceae sp. PMI808]